MSETAADRLVETLIDWGIDTIFGLPGDGINGIMEALRRRRDRVRFIHVCHEEAAAFMATGYAKFTGRLGCCLATSGPGGVHLLNGLYDAKLDGAPILAITGLQYHDLVGTMTAQDVALDKLFMDVAAFNERAMGAAHIENLVNLACRTAIARKGVAHITIPSDTQAHKMTEDKRSRRNKEDRSAMIDARGLRVPPEHELKRAADILNGGRKIALLVGQGALGAGVEVERLAECLGAPIAKALLGKAVVPDASPLTTGGIGMLGTLPSRKALQECDTLLIVGSTMPYLEFYPKPGDARCVQIDLDPERIGLRYTVDVGLVGDAKPTIEALLPLLKPKGDRSFLNEAQEGMRRWNEMMLEQASDSNKPLQPQVVAHELGKRIPDNAIVTGDCGSVTFWWARHIPAKRGQMYSTSGTLASMGSGLPYAIAAQLAHPDRPVFTLVGDGGFLMLMAELATAVRYKLPIRIVVIQNRNLGMIRWEQMFMEGNPEYGCDLPEIDFAGFARACGAAGFVVDDPKDCGRVLDEALAVNGPVLVEARVDPQTLPMPGK